MEKGPRESTATSLNGFSLPSFNTPTLAAWRSSLRYCPADPVWKPTYVQFRPLAGVAALLIALCCSFASLSVLVASNGRWVESWSIQPAVYLAVIAAIMNSSLQIAIAQALPISWWYRALRGCSITELERQWEVGSSALYALRYFPTHLSNTSVGTIAVALLIVNGPLLQKASTVGSGSRISPVSMAVMVAPEVPTGFSGYFGYGAIIPSSISLQVVHDWLHERPMKIHVKNCKGTCTGKLLAPSLAKINCTSRTWPFTPDMSFNGSSTWGPWHYYDDSSTPGAYIRSIFEVDLEPIHEISQPGGALLKVGRLRIFDGEGEYVQNLCALVPAIAEYKVSIADETVRLDAHESNIRIVDMANNTESTRWSAAPDHIQPQTFETLLTFLRMTIQSNATFYKHYKESTNETWTVNTQSFSELATRNFNLSSGHFDLSFYDPAPMIIQNLNEMAFRAGVATAQWANITELMDPGLTPKQTVTFEQHTTGSTFRSNLRWWAGATALDVLTILIVVPLFNRWWIFDRFRSLSPFEVALAFNASLLQSVPSNAGAEGVIQELGDLQVRFGAVAQAEAETQKPDDASGQKLGPCTSSGQRLGVNRMDKVEIPRKGTRIMF